MKVFILLCVVGAAVARPELLDGLEHSHEAHHEHPQPYEEPVGPPQPYQFTYQAGRYPNHVDRTHSESRGTDGVVVGTYEYLDPLKRVVKVDYTADQNGFHPNVQGPVPQAPRESAAVAAARENFFTRSAQIVAEQARIGQEHARLRAIAEAERAQREAAEQQQYQ
ncbi:cuticle protein 6-like [Amphibalanus amphitrite]|uniref:cuticle protein 6-like n=1 Tax=Amphibalanus amphitrite TaxID=1232801 RepID=UPI001C90FC5B|nr:cuticle protein 6-like [Amphibalanus amphitrite]XP_043220445.1 cuticle protein 6-like [Amphibalanus amphitrite]